MKKNTGINDLPEKITVGVTPYLEKYDLQDDQLLIHFTTDAMVQIDLETFLLKNKLEKFQVDGKKTFARNSSEKTLRTSKLVEPALPVWVRLKQPVQGPYQLQKFLNEFLVANSTIVRIVTPIYYLEGQGEQTASSPTDSLVIKFDKNIDEKKIEEMIGDLEANYDLQYDEELSKKLKSFHYFRVKNPIDFQKGELSYIGIKKKLSSVEGIASVNFEWIAVNGYLFSFADDPYLSSQWNLRQIQAPIQSGDVFRTMSNSSGIYLAIVDSGFDLDHEDLKFSPNDDVTRNYTHFNAEEAQLNRREPYYAGPSIFPHGTLVAGAAAASMNNGRGIGSVAGGCEIMPVRIGVIITDIRVALGLNWARGHRAKVVNLSLRCVATEAIVDTIQDTWDSGLVICAATGNNAGNTSSPPICFPAQHTNVIAVGASDREDQRKRRRTTPYESECWASQYGQELDVIAPGVLIWTTDERGIFGWNQNNGGRYTDPPWCIDYPSCGDLAGNYLSVFGGTSASSPQVAGLAMLLFTRDPSLTNQQVRNIIEQTCDKVSPEIYAYHSDASHPNGTWNEEVGYGRINCSAALSKASSPPLGSPQTVPTSSGSNPRSTLSTTPQIPLSMSSQITKLASIGETASRIVLVFAKNSPIDPNTGQPAADGTEGIYKLDLDKNNPLPDIERIPLLENASKVVPPSFYNNKDITLLAITTDTITEQVGVSYVTADPNNSATSDIFFSGKIIGDIYHHCPLTPKPVAGRINNIAGKFYTDGDHFVTFYNFVANGVDNLGWLGRH
jgi:subtilisin family serine protease